MRTQNKNYELPAAEHDVLDDLNKINETLEAIDEDISAVETAASHLSTNVNDIVNLGVHTDQLQNTTVDNMAANGYLVVSSDGSKLQTIEGGGDAGGNKHEVLVKKSDKNYDTEWKTLFKVGKELRSASVAGNSNINSNTSIILDSSVVECSENTAVDDNQIKTDYELELNNSYILTNNAENVPQIESKKATTHNLGIVKIGNGIDVENGSISVFGGGDATKSEFGTVQPGAGFSLDDGALSFDGYDIASVSKAGILRVGSDFTVNENGELEMIVSGEPIIYNLGKIKGIYGNKIIVEENVGLYRAEISSDTDFTIDTSNFTQTKDISFYVEIVANDVYFISFMGEEAYHAIKGTNLYKLSRLYGDSNWKYELIKSDGITPEILTVYSGFDVNACYLIWSNSNAQYWIADAVYKNNTSVLTWTRYPRILHFVFASPVIVSSLYWNDSVFDAENPVELKASNDGINWKTILSIGGYIDGSYMHKVSYLGEFSRFKIEWSGSREIRGFALFGYPATKNIMEFQRVSPQLDTLVTDACELTGCNANIVMTQANNRSNPQVDKDSSTGNVWLQYNFAQPVVANILQITGSDNQRNWCPGYYAQQLVASNDGENWDTLLEIPEDKLVPQIFAGIYEFKNTTAYKHYKYIGQTGASRRICRFILYRRESVE